MRRRRIRIHYTRYPHWGRHSGITQFVQHLDASRFEVSLTPVSDGDDDLPLPFPPLRRWLRRRVQRRGMAWYKLSDLAAELRALPGCLTGATDLVHVLDGEHGTQFLPAWLGGPARRTRLIATYHQPPSVAEDLLDPGVLGRLDRITVMAPSQRPFFVRYLAAERVRTILHGIDTDFFVPGVPRSARDGVFRCVTVGHWLRDWDSFVGTARALAGSADIAFEVVTDRPTGAEGLRNVTVHQGLDDAALRAVYQQADLLFLPLVNSTANNALLEGIACGLPAVSTDLAAVRAYLPDGEAVLTARGDVRGYAEAILRLRDDAPARREMAGRARARAEILSWRHVARAYEELYAEALDG